LYGPPGTGKTTTIINLIQEYQTNAWNDTNTPRKYGTASKHKENVIHLNASDERGIDIIRNQINQFVKSNHLFEQGLKFVILDEVDYMTKNAQQALKSLLQMCRPNVRFCLICNYISKIDESLQHEFLCVRFNQLPKTDIYKFIRNIADLEDVPLKDDDIETIQNNYHSDIRSMINFIQLNAHSFGGERDNTSRVVSNEHWKTIHELLVLSPTEARRLHGEYTCQTYIQMLSIQYNIDKRKILNSYFNYVIRNYPNVVSESFLNIADIVVHTPDDVPIQHIIQYFKAHTRVLMSGRADYIGEDLKPHPVGVPVSNHYRYLTPKN
jgi:replication factor C subunit 3/5